jgi:hypothetical protein
MTEQEIIDVVTAFKNEKKIQSRAHANLPSYEPYKWLDNPKPLWDFSCNDYRVVPEPKVIFVNEYQGAMYVHSTEEIALKRASTEGCRKAVKYIEVIEG